MTRMIGPSLVKPSVNLRDKVAVTSAAIATASRSQVPISDLLRQLLVRCSRW